MLLQDVDSPINPYLLSVVVGFIRMFVGLITSQLLYKFGRRPLILSSLLSMAVLMFTSGGFIFSVRGGKYILLPRCYTIFVESHIRKFVIHESCGSNE